MVNLILTTLFLFTISPSSATLLSSKPDDIVNIKKYLPQVKLDIRYFSKRNFIGEEIKGYLAASCLIQDHVGQSLKQVQQELNKKNLELIIYDCYRPQLAVDHFVAWAKELSDQRMKSIFYPDVNKEELFSRGYIASKSGHSKANTIDLGIIIKGSEINKIISIPLKDCRIPLTQKEKATGLIEMGTQYDCFDSMSLTKTSKISAEAKYNREQLVNAMEKYGFKNYSKEWWHFSHSKNIYPTTYHQFFVE